MRILILLVLLAGCGSNPVAPEPILIDWEGPFPRDTVIYWTPPDTTLIDWEGPFPRDTVIYHNFGSK